MPRYLALLLSAAWLSVVDAQSYTVHSSFVFSNTGDRTPLLDASRNPMLTNLGAQQMYNLGAYFRRRYIAAGTVDPFAESTMLEGLSSWQLDPDEIYVQTVDAQYTTSSAMAFLQGFYPPYELGSGNRSSLLDSSGITSNNTYIEAPLGGYQYPRFDTVSSFDPYSVYLTGTSNCENFAESALQYYNTVDFNVTALNTRTFYQSLGQAVLNGVLPQDQWSYANAYLIYDYISYQYAHNSTIYELLQGSEYTDSVERLHDLASQKQWEIYGDQSVSGAFPGDKIRTIGGQTLAARIIGLLSNNIGTGGASTKFILSVGEYDVMMALASLLNLATLNSNFEYMPPYASAYAFELFSYTNASTRNTYPSPDDLWVRFLYINGSLTDENPNPSIQAYSLFNRGPSETDMRWSDFYEAMLNVGLENVGDWCVLCDSNSIFCPAFTDDNSATGSSSSRKRHSVSAPVAGAIGAIVTLAVAVLLFALVMLVGGVRFHRNNKSKKHDLGGFKGSNKLASDADLHLPKNSAPIGIAANKVGDKPKGHERVGSWELKDKKDARDTYSSFGGATVKGDDYGRKNSVDEDHDGINPFATPVNPRESV